MIFQILIIAWLGVRSRLGRSILTALSLFIGVLAIVVIQAGAGAAQDAVMSNAILTGGRAMTLSLNVSNGRRAFGQADQLLSHLNNVLAPVKATAVMTVDADSTLFPGGSVEMTLVKGDLREIRPFPVRRGEWIGSGSDIVLPVVINEATSANFGLTTGMTFSISPGHTHEQVNVRVIGVITDGMKEPNAYAPLDLTQSWVKQLAGLVSPKILIHADSGTSQAQLTGLIRNEYFRFFDTERSPEISRIDQADDFAQTLGTIKLIFSIIAGLSLVVGAMGILNIGLATLRERSDELSLHRSFGATRLQVIAIIVLEGQIVALSAACIAIVFGLFGFPLAASFLSQGIEVSLQNFPYEAAVIGVVACCFAAFIGSLVPAIRAGHVPIASIMRL
ncbi:MAG: ABC transporter permease [Dethiobacteria bacterium]|jgi:putative ABC transport system permease protein|nr:ABC transporter permease [Bacillota bacterium]HOB29494.1 ABC transporter permease [Bacillota bacterium]